MTLLKSHHRTTTRAAILTTIAAIALSLASAANAQTTQPMSFAMKATSGPTTTGPDGQQLPDDFIVGGEEGTLRVTFTGTPAVDSSLRAKQVTSANGCTSTYEATEGVVLIGDVHLAAGHAPEPLDVAIPTSPEDGGRKLICGWVTKVGDQEASMGFPSSYFVTAPWQDPMDEEIDVETAATEAAIRAHRRCLTLNLRNATITQAKARLTRAHCKLGQVRRIKGRGVARGRVIKPVAGRSVLRSASAGKIDLLIRA